MFYGCPSDESFVDIEPLNNRLVVFRRYVSECSDTGIVSTVLISLCGYA